MVRATGPQPRRPVDTAARVPPAIGLAGVVRIHFNLVAPRTHDARYVHEKWHEPVRRSGHIHAIHDNACIAVHAFEFQEGHAFNLCLFQRKRLAIRISGAIIVPTCAPRWGIRTPPIPQHRVVWHHHRFERPIIAGKLPPIVEAEAFHRLLPSFRLTTHDNATQPYA